MNRAAIYTRISRDAEGLELGVARQEQDCRALASKLKIADVQVFTDNDKGASDRSTKKRPQYAAMLEAVRAGEYSHIIAYSNSRLTRRMLELEDLIKLHEQTKVVIKTVVSGDDDLSTADGRMVARIKASVDVAEVDRLAERLSRAYRQRAEKGLPHTGTYRPFGWNEDRLTINPQEAAILKEVIGYVLAGLPTTAIAERLQEERVPTPWNGPWHFNSLKRILQHPRLAGLQTYRGEIIRNTDGSPVMGQWEPLITVDEHEQLVAVLTARSRAVSHRHFGKHLLSPLLRCGKCGSKMHGTIRRRGEEVDSVYICTRHRHTSIAGKIVELHVLRSASELFMAGDAASSDAEPSRPTEFPEQERLSQVVSRRSELMAAFTEGTLSSGVVFPEVAKLEAEEAELLAQRTTWLAQQPVPKVYRHPKHLMNHWLKAEVPYQRAFIQSQIGTVVIMPSRYPGDPNIKERVEIVKRGEASPVIGDNPSPAYRATSRKRLSKQTPPPFGASST